ncbi:hypothetical protein [Litoreibacter janthinus]|uniref:Uncharacterized protein n=1 Tax=Litoreibacter janthinus TaxID=670154 RepID=A0A1I6HRP1_9RHOB|nr:hypothetical protein [Litoreibacter janthinus]SFR57093.1 hypothetical protein SAMN04488002_3309 [Litoreibacter janthinus]
MSDPVTNVDVEDVLSSIRRLVSDTNAGHREASKTEDQPEPTDSVEPAPEEAKPAEALILTSALRVNSPTKDQPSETPHTEMPNFRHRVSGDTPEVADDNAAPVSDHADWPSMANEDYYEDDETSESAPVIDFIRHSRKVDVEPETVAEVEDAWATDLSEHSVDDEGDHPEEAASDEDQHEEASEASEQESPEPWANFDGDDFDDLEDEDDEPETIDELSNDSVEIDHDADDAEELSEASDEDDFEDTDILAEEVVFASAAAASVMPNSDEEETSEVDLGDFDESVIDEDALRDLVAEIVRQELTGELGERITRNVRKLVRREIHRALLTREFD